MKKQSDRSNGQDDSDRLHGSDRAQDQWSAPRIPTVTDDDDTCKIMCERFREATETSALGGLCDTYFRYISTEELLGEFVRLYAPVFDKAYDFSKAKILPDDMIARSLTRRVADLVLLAPSRNKKRRDLVLYLIVEHKAQRGNDEDAHTLIQTSYYMLETAYRAIEKNRKARPRVFGLVVYTGPKPYRDALSWEEQIALDEDEAELARYQPRIEIPCVNLTDRYAAGEILESSPMLETACNILGCVGNGTLKRDIKKIFLPLLRVQNWDKNGKLKQFFYTSLTFCVQQIFKRSRSAGRDLIDKVVESVTPKHMRDEMKAFFLDQLVEEMKDEWKEEGELKLQRENICDWLTELFGPDSNALQATVREITQLSVLTQILRLFRRLRTLEEFEQGVNEILADHPDAFQGKD